MRCPLTLTLLQKCRQLSNIRGDPPRLIRAEQLTSEWKMRFFAAISFLHLFLENAEANSIQRQDVEQVGKLERSLKDEIRDIMQPERDFHRIKC